MNIAGVVIPQAGRLAERYRTGEALGRMQAEWELSGLKTQEETGVQASPWQQVKRTFWYEPILTTRTPQEELLGVPKAIVTDPEDVLVRAGVGDEVSAGGAGRPAGGDRQGRRSHTPHPQVGVLQQALRLSRARHAVCLRRENRTQGGRNGRRRGQRCRLPLPKKTMSSAI